MKVPEVLLSGNHKRIDSWRHEMRLKRTFERRPDLLAHYPLTQSDKDYLEQLKLNN